jgi:hypothetical protein
VTAKEHNKLIGIFMLVQGGLQAFGGLMAALIYGGMGLGFMSSARNDEEQIVGTVFIIFTVVFTPIILIIAGIAFAAGWKLIKEKSGARTWGIVASIVALCGFPLGTALGIYGLWFFFSDQGKHFYANGGNGQMYGSQPPPPPNHWQ